MARPTLEGKSPDTLDQLVGVSQLKGALDEDGFATIDGLSTERRASVNHPKDGPGSGTSDEDYDRIVVDPSTVIRGSKGGDLPATPSLEHSESSNLGGSGINHRTKSIGTRRNSIPITLEKTGTRGRYLLKTDEPVLKELLHRSIQREASGDGKKRRKHFSDLVFTRQFTAFDRQNPNQGESPFHGFFVLFWLCIAGMLIKIAAGNWKSSGSIFGTNELLTMMFHRDVMVLGLSDVFMMMSTVFSFWLQKAIFAGWLSWDGQGWIIQSVWEIFYLSGTIRWTIHRDWPWQHTVFIVLHCIVMLMKQHSYGFYLGHLSGVYRRKLLLEAKLEQLDFIDSPQTGSDGQPAVMALATSYFDGQSTKHLHRRQKSLQGLDDRKGRQGLSDLKSVAEAIEAGEVLNPDQSAAFERVLQSEIDDLDGELKGKCTDSKNYYPYNLNIRDFAGYIPLPTVVYEMEYPRQEKINWPYVVEKTVATFGVIGVMIVVSQAFIYPVVMETIKMKEDGMPLEDRLKEFPWILGDLLFPFLVEYLMAWYVIWECVLNLLAELTCFADRGFYADWWNSVSWDQFARDWNVPVHRFLLRHVYHSSIASFRVSKLMATLITFLLSAFVHELIMWCIFKKLRGYLMVMQMLQLPLAMLSKTQLLRQRKLLGNIVFWIGIFTGPSLLCSLYLVI